MGEVVRLTGAFVFCEASLYSSCFLSCVQRNLSGNTIAVSSLYTVHCIQCSLQIQWAQHEREVVLHTEVGYMVWGVENHNHVLGRDI